ncbi:MAG: hypothetical protein ACEY3D_03020 [Rickettsia sp.]|uniref:hypothetical protein n=1 Tax=Rickettsia sp. TaxID=789 RepID=UPI003978EC2D
MFKITRAARQILNSTKYIKDLVASSTNTITKYLKLSENQGYIEDVSHEFLFEKKLSEFANLKVQNSLNDLHVVIHKEGAIDWAAVRKLIYARFADEIRENKIIIPIKAEAVKGISEEFECLRAQGYDFKSVVNLIEQKKAAVSNKYELEVGSNVSSSSLIDRMKKLSIAGYLSNYAGDDGLRQSIEEVIHNKAYLMQEFMLRVSSAKAYEVNLVQLESIDILGDH